MLGEFIEEGSDCDYTSVYDSPEGVLGHCLKTTYGDYIEQELIFILISIKTIKTNNIQH